MEEGHSEPRPGAVETIFTAALALPPGDRPDYLASACGGDAQLRQRVEALLLAHEAPQGFLPERPSAGLDGALSISVLEKPGDRIGRYKLLQKIGEGGCGVVYMAEQEEPVRRKVALKVIKLGMDTRQVVARFEAERQALALMDHPSIARVLDAGATDTGRPYFVMELVGGIKITDYCEQKQLNTRQRLDLFVQVCRAVQHAHQKGVIHRDIKPSNVLVATQDGVAVPKVIDFGIAKATQGRLTDDTVFTAFEQFLGTPAYMSPEQAQVGGLDVDTRSDIYSLGVLLYELLTGKTPFDAKELLAAGLEAMRRTIQEKEPPTPSTRLAQERLATRSTTPVKSELVNLKSEIDKELDWIVMKCLEKDRARRYETANGLAMDLQRHLNDEPVLAGPPSNFYRLQKLVRRNKVPFAATGAVVLALVLGLGLSTFLFFHERAARREQARLRQQAQTEKTTARAEAAKSQQVAQFLKDMLQGVGPSKALGRDTTMLREILDKTAERVGKELTNQPEVAFELSATLADIYDELGLYEQSERIARENLTLARLRLGGESATVAEALVKLGSAHRRLANFDQADKLLREGVDMQRRFSGNESLETACALNNLAVLQLDRGNYAEGAELLRQALPLYTKLFGDEHADVAPMLRNLAGALHIQGKLEEAETMYRQALALQRKLLVNEHPDTATSLNNLGALLSEQGKLDEGETMLRQAVAMERKLLGDEHPELAKSLGNLALALDRQDKLSEAESLIREALALQRKLLGNGHPDVAISVVNLALLLQREGKFGDVETLFREQLPELRAGLHGNPLLAKALAAFASTLLLQRKFAEAEPLIRECLSIREEEIPDDWRTFSAKSMLGSSLLGQKKYSEAEPFLLSGYEGLKLREAKVPAGSKSTLTKLATEGVQNLVQLYDATGRPDQAAEWKQKLEELDRANNSRTTE